jgi:hypothetical protein
MTKNEVLGKLSELTGGCSIQHRGCPCGTCFATIDFGKGAPKNLWESVLLYRGDYENGKYFYQTKEELSGNIKWLKSFLKEE